jgi:diaminopimelate epimerase
MRFAKYQGIGNDFVMFADPDDELALAPHLVRALCDRRFGIGGDGVIRVGPGREGAELTMDYVNSDGSIGEMCGNGIRCLALFARAEGMTERSRIEVATVAGVKVVEVVAGDRVRVDMGPPIFLPRDIPVDFEGPDALHVKLDLTKSARSSTQQTNNSAENRWCDYAPTATVIEAACLSMGNPHAVLFVDDPDDIDVAGVGSLIETHQAFPNRANVEFVKVESPQRVAMRVWERGAGETRACGTGACAAAVAARLLAGSSADVTVTLPGGELEISWAGSLEKPSAVFMTGPAGESFRGEVELEAYR